MATLNVTFVSSMDSVDYKLSKAEILRGIVADKLTTAAQEILAVVERTVAGYEEEASRLRQEIDRQRRQLEVLLQPRVKLCRIDDQFPVYVPEPGGGGGGGGGTRAQLPEEEEHHRYDTTVEDSGTRDILGHAEEEEGEDERKANSVEPAQSLDQEDRSDPDHLIPNARGQSVKAKRRMSGPLNLRVCLLQDSFTSELKTGVLKSPVQELRCPRGLQETDFLDLLRSTFPQLTGQFDVFTADANKKLTPLKLQTLTPEEIQRSIKSTGKGRSALYIQVKKSPTGMEQLPPPWRKGEATNKTRDDTSCGEEVESNKAEETEEDGEQRGVSDDFSGLSSAPSAADSEGEDDDGDDNEGEEDDRDDDWKPDKNNGGVEHSGLRTERRRRMPSSLKRDCSKAPVACKVCLALSGSRNLLTRHAWIHVGDPERLCGVCGEQSESADELRSHLQSHQKTHNCNTCGKCFLRVDSLERHTALHRGERPYKCDICHKTYSQKGSLRIHQWEHVENKPHTCDVCHQSFAFQEQLRIHSRTHAGKKRYSCDLCGKSVSDLRSLSQHKMGHTGEKRFSCPVCGKRFLTPRKVKEHGKIHTNRDKVHLCDICCKTFHTPGQLKIHLNSHSEVKIMCSECGKGLSSQGALRRHMLIHSGERPYRCSVCGRSFNSNSILKAHLKTHSDIKQFVCGVCGKAFARKEYLKVHMRTHNGERPYKCTVCNKAFTQSHCVKTHMKCHQGGQKSTVDGLKD